MENQTFTIRFDARTKAVIVKALTDAYAIAASKILTGDYTDETLTNAEELSQVIRGVLYTRPEAPAEEATQETEVVDSAE